MPHTLNSCLTRSQTTTAVVLEKCPHAEGQREWRPRAEAEGRVGARGGGNKMRGGQGGTQANTSNLQLDFGLELGQESKRRWSSKAMDETHLPDRVGQKSQSQVYHFFAGPHSHHF